MITTREIIDDVLGRAFEFECCKISLRGRDDSVPYYFSGPGSISGEIAGSFTFLLHNLLEKEGREFMSLYNSARKGELPVCLDAVDYHGREWTGGWCVRPILIGNGPSRCCVTGKVSQLSIKAPLGVADEFKNTTVNYYPRALELPMLEMVEMRRVRGDDQEEVGTNWDRTVLEFHHASVEIRTDEIAGRTFVATSYDGAWVAPICEVAMADAIAFVCATTERPRVTVRYSETDALIFVRETLRDTRSGLPRPIAYQGPRDVSFWQLFLAFLQDCKNRQLFDSTPLSKTVSELIAASTGTIHATILSLVVGIEELVSQLTGPPPRTEGIADLKKHVQDWNGDERLKNSAVRLIASGLSRKSTTELLRNLAQKNVVTDEQVDLWVKLRPRLAHGKITDYGDEQLMANRRQLIMMFYRLALRLLNYKGSMSDYGVSPSGRLDFQWEA